MSMSLKQKQGILRNKLLRYKQVVDYYHEVYNEDIPLTRLHSKYIYPKFHISRVTLYNILNTPIDKQLKELAEAERAQLDLF